MTDALKLAEELERAPFGEEHRLVRCCLECGLRNKWISMRQWKRADAMVKAGAYLSAADVLRPRVPEQYDFIVERVNGGLTISCRMGTDGKRVFAETEPMARAAAAIRAWVAMETQHD